MPTKLTMGDVAERAGVSRSTVSRVLSGESVVADETAERVRQIAMKLGYQVRPPRNRDGDAPIFVPKRVAVIARQPLLAGLAPFGNGLYTHLARQGYQVDMIMQGDLTEEKLATVRGAILVNVRLDDQLQELLHDTPWIQARGKASTANPTADLVTYDNATVGVIAADWLCSQGSRNLVAIMPANPVARVRSTAFREHAQQQGARVELIESEATAIDGEQAAKAVAQLQAMSPKPDGVFAYNDHTLLCLYPLLFKAGFDPQVDLKLIGCDGESFLTALHPRPATIDVHMAQLAKRTVETLLWRLDNPDDRPITIMLHPELIEPDRLASVVNQHLTASMA